MTRRHTRQVAFAVLAVAALTLVLHAAHDPLQLSLPGAKAIESARADAGVRDMVERAERRRGRSVRASAAPLDPDVVRVSFRQGLRNIVDVAVDAEGTIVAVQPFEGAQVYGGGSLLANNPWLWLALGSAFLLAMAGTRPLSVRTADALVLLAVMVCVWAYNRSYIVPASLLGYPLLAWLLGRCIFVLVRARGAGGDLLWSTLGRRLPTAAWRPIQSFVAMALIAMLALMASLPIISTDVGYASMAGATLLLDGTLPYGNISPEIVHGDTYPPLAYVLYVPVAMVWPVSGIFDAPDGALAMSGAAAVATGLVLWRMGGARMAIAWAAFPLVVIGSASGSNDMLVCWLLALAAWSLKRPALSAAALATAAGTKLAPVVLVPALLALQRGRPLARSLNAIAAVIALAMAPVLATGGVRGLGKMMHAVAFQTSRGTPRSLWANIDIPVLQQLAQSIVLVGLALLAMAAWGATSRLGKAGGGGGPPVDPARACAGAAAALLAVQLVANHWTPLYLLWTLPLLLVALAPAASDASARGGERRTRTNV